MSEARARAWLEANGVDRGTIDRLARYVTLLLDENRRQNLIARSTEDDIWWRHIVDSAQLARFCHGVCIDLGSGPGLPGLVLALMGHDVTLVEMRARRVGFLHACIDEFGLPSRVIHERAEHVNGRFETVTARAFASINATIHVASRWPQAKLVLPRGERWHDDIIVLDADHRVFHVEQSVTNDASAIIVVEPAGRRG